MGFDLKTNGCIVAVRGCRQAGSKKSQRGRSDLDFQFTPTRLSMRIQSVVGASRAQGYSGMVGRVQRQKPSHSYCPLAVSMTSTPNTTIHRTSGKLRLPASGDFQR